MLTSNVGRLSYCPDISTDAVVCVLEGGSIETPPTPEKARSGVSITADSLLKIN